MAKGRSDEEIMDVLRNILMRKAEHHTIIEDDTMKLLFCLDCMDLFNLRKEPKTCGCGKTTGHYINDVDAEYSGNAQILGIGNTGFTEAIRVQFLENKEKRAKKDCCEGVKFLAFTIPAHARSITKVDE